MRIINADVVEGLKQLPDESVHCVVTSPPYYALRDYATGKWEGGDPDCKHSIVPMFATKSKKNGHDENADDYFRHIGHCAKCGAVRKDRQVGLEETPEQYVQKMVEICREVRRVLRKDGTFWLNIGDTYATNSFGNANDSSGTLGYTDRQKQGVNISHNSRTVPEGYKAKDLMGIPWRVAFALQADGWWLRQDIIWHKPNPMPESVTDRCTKCHEYIFLLTKSPQYYYDADAIRDPVKEEDMRKAINTARKLGYDGSMSYEEWYNTVREGKDWVNKKESGDALTFGQATRGKKEKKSIVHPMGANKRDVWTISVRTFKDAHFATYPPELVRPCVLAGTSEKGCCSKCGAPYQRMHLRTGEDGTQVKVKAQTHVAKNEQGKAIKGANNPFGDQPRVRTGVGKKPIVHKETIGWEPSCNCNAEVVPCTVMDIFGGSGTTAMVANRLGRDAILIELSPEYCELAEKRIHNSDPLFVNIEKEKSATLESFIS